MGRTEERFGCRRTPVDQQAATLLIGETYTADIDAHTVPVHGLSEAQVQTAPAQDPDSAGEPVDLPVPVGRCLAVKAPRTTGRLPGGRQLGGQITNRSFETRRDRSEVRLVPRDERRVRLRGEAIGKTECTGALGAQQRLPSIESGCEAHCAVRRHPHLDPMRPLSDEVRYMMEWQDQPCLMSRPIAWIGYVPGAPGKRCRGTIESPAQRSMTRPLRCSDRYRGDMWKIESGALESTGKAHSTGLSRSGLVDTHLVPTANTSTTRPYGSIFANGFRSPRRSKSSRER